MNPTTTPENFKFFLPIDIQKGKNAAGESVYKIEGKASKERRDSQGETMVLKGMDVSNLKVINWNHKSKDNPDAYLGEVTNVFFKGDEMYFKGELYPEMPMAAGAINLMKALKKRGKQLGVSIEGSVVQRGSWDKKDPAYKTVTKSKLTALALTPNPVNSDTYAELFEKGFYTENLEWEFDQETEDLMKSFESGELEKSFSVEENQHVVKEDVEGPKNKKDIEEDEDEDKQSLSKKVSKSDTYEQIINYFYDINIEKAQQIYKLIEKIADMENTEITQETINKAFATLKEVSIEKGESTNSNPELDEMVSKATEIVKGMVTAGLEGEELTDAMIEKGYSQKVIDLAMSNITEEPIVKSDNVEILKSIDALGESIGNKFAAVANIYESQASQLEEIQKSVDAVLGRNEELEAMNTKLGEDLTKSLETITHLNDTIQKFAKTSGPRRAVTGFVEKGFGADGQPLAKSEDANTEAYDLKNGSHRAALVAKLNEQSGIFKGGNYDTELVTIAQGIEIAKSVDARSMGRLNAMGITIIQ